MTGQPTPIATDDSHLKSIPIYTPVLRQPHTHMIKTNPLPVSRPRPAATAALPLLTVAILNIPIYTADYVNPTCLIETYPLPINTMS